MQPVTSAGWSYTDYAQLPGSISDDAEGLQKAAKHFESLFINMWLKSARDANAALAKDSFFSSNEMEMQQQMFDSQMAMHLAKEGGVGLAPVIIRQLGGNVANPPVDPLGESPDETTQLLVLGSRDSKFADPQEFVQTIAPRVKEIVGAAGLPPLTVMAQAALETGWGNSVITSAQGESSHNLFGMKDTDWVGSSVEIHSKEYLLGNWQDKLAGFRSYPDWDAGIQDYVSSMAESSRYGAAKEQNLGAAEYAEFLQRSGYATDPNYAQKLKGIMHRLIGLGF
jgi:flagellar protein FlgJ